MKNYNPLSDNSPEVEAMLIAPLRQAPAWRKSKMVGDLNATLKLFALAGIRQSHPNATAQGANRHLADLLPDEELGKSAKVTGNKIGVSRAIARVNHNQSIKFSSNSFWWFT